MEVHGSSNVHGHGLMNYKLAQTPHDSSTVSLPICQLPEDFPQKF